MSTVEPLMRRNFLEYASYVNVDRAIPDQRDGCKPVQRRILHTMFTMDDGKFNKVANVIGECMKLHPHGDVSIGDALVVLANKEYFIERQGNYGSIITGHGAAAARYIECRLTPLAKECLFNPRLTEWMSSYDGRREEPVYLPSKLPVVLMLGVEGIGVGMATEILPHNFLELIDAQIALLRDEPVALLPDFPQGGIMDASEYADGAGRVRVRARIEARGEKTVVITEIPFGTTTESVIASIEAAAAKGKVKIAGINDFTTERPEIEVSLPRGVYADEVIPQLFAYTQCEQSVNSSVLVIRDGRPAQTTVIAVLRDLTERLRAIIKAELEMELADLEAKRHWLTLEQIFIENRVYKRIEEQRTEAGVTAAVHDGMAPFAHLFVRPMIDEDIDRLLKLPIRRISAYDMGKNRKDLDELVAAIADVQRRLKQLTRTVIAWLEGIRSRHAIHWPRRTRIETFSAVDKKAVARSNIKVSYDAESGFFGSAVKGERFAMQVSEYDQILIISDDGSWRVLRAPEKVLIPAQAIWVGLIGEAGRPFTIVYRDNERECFVKKVRLESFRFEREYELIKDKAGRIDQLIEGDAKGVLHCTFVKQAKARVTECDFDLASVEFSSSVTARGTRAAPKPVARLRLQS